MEQIGVSIVCNTYNQENYISDALDSFLMQKTNFKYEVLIHDDASTDNTPKIIKEYEEKYPDIIKPIYQKENQYGKGFGISLLYQYPRIKGKYVAFCEGDDYWTDPLKLQKQYDILESYPEIDICTHGAIMVNSETKKEIKKITPSKESRIMPMEEVIMGDGGYVAANSIFYRAELNKDIPEFRKQFKYQFAIKLQASIKGGMYYIADVMSEYRSCAKGSWTLRMASNPQKWISFHEAKTNMFHSFDEYTEYKYTNTVKEKINEDKFWLSAQLGKYKEMFKKENKKYFKKLPLKTKISLFLRAYFPGYRQLIKK